MYGRIEAEAISRVSLLFSDAGELEQLSRGVYRLAEPSPLSNPDLAMVGKRVPQGVARLISALAFHEHRSSSFHLYRLSASPQMPSRQAYRSRRGARLQQVLEFARI